jgi:hypothetical protein
MKKLDLHNFTVREAMAVFVRFYNAQFNQAHPAEIEVVHGYGSSGEGGEIRKRLRKYLAAHTKKILVRKGEHVTGNPGVTYVTPLQPLPSASDALENEILDYCDLPRSEAKIIGKFRNSGQKKVKATLRKLVKDGALRRFQKGAYPHYQSI